MDIASEQFRVEAMVHSYNVYKSIWEAVVREELRFEREPGNRQDPFAVAMVRSAVTVITFRRRYCLCAPCFFDGVVQSSAM